MTVGTDVARGLRAYFCSNLAGTQTTAIYLNFTDTHIQEEFERKW